MQLKKVSLLAAMSGLTACAAADDGSHPTDQLPPPPSEAELAEALASVDQEDAAEKARAYEADPGAFEEFHAPSPVQSEVVPDGVEQQKFALSVGCVVANYGNPHWWVFVGVIDNARRNWGYSKSDCLHIVENAGRITDHYGAPFIMFTGGSGRCACKKVY